MLMLILFSSAWIVLAVHGGYLYVNTMISMFLLTVIFVTPRRWPLQAARTIEEHL